MMKNGHDFNGPRNFGVRVFKINDSGPGVREVILPCYGLIQSRTEIEDNGGFVEIVAQEGEYLEHTRGSVFVPPDTQKGEVVGHYEDRDDIRLLVPEHPRDEKFEGLKLMSTISKMQESDAKRKREAKRAQFMGEPMKEEPGGEPEPAAAAAAEQAAGSGGGDKSQGGRKGPSVSSKLGGSA